MTSIMEELKEDEIAEMSSERLGKLLLHHLVDAQILDKAGLLRNLELTVTPNIESGASTSRTASKLEVVIDWLFRNQLIVSNEIRGDNNQIILTQEGRNAINLGEFQSRSIALSRISHTVIHPVLQRSRLYFLEGEYDVAISEAIQTIEERIRSLVPSHKSQLPVAKLVSHAFGKNGKLADENDREKSRVMKGLLVAALGVDIAYFGSTRDENDLNFMYMVSEIILLNNLLHRYIDQCEQGRRNPQRLLA